MYRRVGIALDKKNEVYIVIFTILDMMCLVARSRILYAKWALGEEVFLACPCFEMCRDIRCDATTRAENVKVGKGANLK
jgi:hypothetical protein